MSNSYRVLEARFVGELKVWPKDAHGMVGKWNNWWMMGCPRCGQVVRLSAHEVNLEEDLVTVSPSIGHPACGAHFYVRAGKIQVLGDM